MSRPSSRTAQHALYLGLIALHAPLTHAATLSISRLGSGDGLICDNNSQINCGTECTIDFPPHTDVQLSATPDGQSRFINWSAGACAGHAEVCAFETSDAPQIIAAYFAGASVVAGGYHTVALRSTDGTLWAWGKNDQGQLGNGTKTNSTVPAQVGDLKDIVSVSAGYQYTAALRNDGMVWAWGNNAKGQLGDGTSGTRLTPVMATGLGGIITLSAGYQHTVALTGDGSVYAWGDNANGQLGDGTTTVRKSPIMLDGVDNIIAIATGNLHTVALRNDGTVWAWGDNANGQLGNGTSTGFSTAPTLVSGLTNVVSLDAGAYHTVALKDDGTVWAWGDNAQGQLGDGSKIDRTRPVQIHGIDRARNISAGWNHTAVLSYDGTVWTYGDNRSGQLGDGTTGSRSKPSMIGGLTDITAIAAGASHTVALTRTGAVLAWGANTDGALGDGTTTDRSTFTAVPSFSTGGSGVTLYTVKASAGTGGSMVPATQSVVAGAQATLTISPKAGYTINTVKGCDGTLSGMSYTTGPVRTDCTVTATFKASAVRYTVKATAGAGGTISPATRTVDKGKTTTFTVKPNSGYVINTVTSTPCSGKLSGNTYTTGAITATCSVQATFKTSAPKTYTVSVTSSGKGTILPNRAQIISAGKQATFTVIPNDGYTASASGCNGTLSDNTYTTGTITANCTVKAVFEPLSTGGHVITVAASDGGIVTPSTRAVNDGEVVAFIITPDTGYTVGVNGCGGTLSDNIYTTAPIFADCTIDATFSHGTGYTVKAVAGANGAIVPPLQTVPFGTSTIFMVTPDSGYTAAVTGCGGALAGNIYTATITQDCTVNATFTRAGYTITATAGPNGNIGPSAQVAQYGEKITFVVAPNAGYVIDKVTGCDGTLSGNTYTTGPIKANCAVSAAFTTIHTVTINCTGKGWYSCAGSVSSYSDGYMLLDGDVKLPSSFSIKHGATLTFQLVGLVVAGWNPNLIPSIVTVTGSGCGVGVHGSSVGTAPITGDCEIMVRINY